jgi:aerobic-type carbon monoxide dehydrogenase small subunit (CoxS/CutS family)
MGITLEINGSNREVEADPDTPLLWVIRDNIELTGTKYGCAVDCCVAVNPDVIRAQMEGGTGYGLSPVLTDHISIKNGVVV